MLTSVQQCNLQLKGQTGNTLNLVVEKNNTLRKLDISVRALII